MTTYNIIIKEDEKDAYNPTRQTKEKYIEFTVGSKSALVSSSIQTVLADNKINLNAPAYDLLDIAVATYTSDQIISRELNGYQGWSRHIRVHMPVTNFLLWQGVKHDLMQMLSFLSGDKWDFHFRERSVTLSSQFQLRLNPTGITKVSLLSGGLDSFIGAVDLLENKEKVFFVSHYKRGSEGKAQKAVLDVLTTKYGKGSFISNKFFVQPKQEHPLASKEDSSRARSFLFLSLGLCLASSFGDTIDLIVPENGLISLNVPLTQTRLSSHSTRTTHPFYFSLFRNVLSGVGIKNNIVNPYQFKSKGEMMLDCQNQTLLSQNYSKTLSCSHADNSHYVKGSRPGIHCGYCVPCIIRQAAEKVSGGPKTQYMHQIKYNPPSTSKKKGRDLRAFKMSLEEIKNLPRHSMILRVLKSGPLPFADKKELNNYIDIYERGMAEVSNFLK